MKAIGIRELRQRASAVLRQVANGETFEVTDRGRAVARLGPPGNESVVEQLRGAGDVSDVTGSLDELGPPPRRPPGTPPVSEILARRRADER
jgi:prevent-host-death family protein